jgi:2-C-methyl-D-erythritol 4-phosphate cytidylyltransferase
LSSNEISIWAIVPAAGSGARMRAGLPKQYLALLGRPVIQHTLNRLCAHASVRGVMVGLAADDDHWRRTAITAPKLLGTFAGGATRAHTVLNGLTALAAHARADDWVMVHDAVRPCLRAGDVDRLIAEATTNPDGGLLALPVSDTVKRVDDSNHVIETVSRANLWRALTPQMFRLSRLEAALQQALAREVEVTDEASAVEAAGGRPVVVAGHPDNIKITMPEDLPLAELFLRQQRSA